MALDQRDVHEVVGRVSARQDFLEACKRHDLGKLIEILGRHGVTQGQMAGLTGIPQGRLSNYKHGKHVPTASHTFQSFADGLGLPAQARLLLGLAPGGDGRDISPATGGLTVEVDTFDLQVLAETIGRRGNDVKRREMLSLVAQIGATAAIAQSDVWERLAYAITKPSAMDESIIREMEARSAGFHRLEEVTPAPALFKALVAHLRELSSLLNGTVTDPADEFRRRLIIVAGESGVLAGWAANDMGDAAAARNYYEIATHAAKEADDPAIAACALGYQSYIPSTRGRNGRSRILLTEALQAAGSAKTSSPGTISWLAARHAEESATLGDKQQALTSWEEAAEAFDLADPEEDRVWTRFLDQNRFDSYRIATYARIGKLDQAQELASTVLERLIEPDRKKAAIILEDIAVAHLTRGAVIDAVRLAKDGLTVVRETEFAMWMPKFEAIGQGLRRYQTQPQVRAYLEDLTNTKRRFAASTR